MDSKDKDWRSNTVVMADNAKYHRSLKVKSFIREMGIPMMYTAPYSPSLSAIEMVFGKIKQGD
jgi:transposase